MAGKGSDGRDGPESAGTAGTPGGAAAPSRDDASAEAAVPEPERSPSGRVVIRSSSHPPVGERNAVRPVAEGTRPRRDARESVSGIRPLPASDEADRSKKATPDERPRRPRRVARERSRQDTPAARPTSRRSVSTPSVEPQAAARPPRAQRPTAAASPAAPGSKLAPGRAAAAASRGPLTDDVPIQQRSSAPPRRRKRLPPAVRGALLLGFAIVLAALAASALR